MKINSILLVIFLLHTGFFLISSQLAPTQSITSLKSSCGIVLDLCFILDVSGSVKKAYFTKAMNSLLNMTDRVNTKHSVHLSLVYFGYMINSFKEMINNESDKKNFLVKLDGIKYEETKEAKTEIGTAVRLASRTLFNTDRDPIAPKIALILTDGLFTQGGKYDIANEISTLKAKGVEVFVVNISNQINFENSKLLVSDPIDEHLLHLDEYKRIFKIVNEKTVRTCDANAFKFIINYDE
jgi:hypothetical protein